jgi:hypothetical protein
MQGLQGWSGGAEDYWDVRALRTHDREIACGISEATFVLFERRVMLFVDDDDPEVGDGGENRRARAEHNSSVTAERLAPGDQPFVIG